MWLFAVLAFWAAVSAGGCGGSSSNSFSDDTANNNGNTNNQPNNQGNTDAAASETVLNLDHNMDTDGNGIPDFVDLSSIPHYDLDSSHATAYVGGMFSSSAMIEAAAMKITVPAVLTLSELRMQEEPNTFTVALEAGKEYTIMFSKNLAEALEAVNPRLKIYDPENAELPELEAEALNVSVKAYPPEHPSIICYTFTPKTAGEYLIRVADAEPSTAFVDSEDVESSDTYDIDTSCMLFIFEEVRDANGDTGHHTQYKFVDVDGKKTEPINIEDLIQLRKELWKLDNNSYNQIVRTSDAARSSGVYASALNVFASATEEESDPYNRWLDRVQDKLGLVAVDNSSEEAEYGETYGEGDDAYGIEYYGADNSYTSNKKLDVANYDYSEIPAEMTGIPYDETYSLGAGFFAITNLSPIGGVRMPGFDEKLAPSEAKYAKSVPSVKTYYTGTFVSTRTEAEAMSNTNGRVSMSKNSMGASASVESTKNFKYGLTSTNYVIHYEEVETKYRLFSENTYRNLLYKDLSMRQPKTPSNPADEYEDEVIEEASVSGAALPTIMDWIEKMPAHRFRNNFGDYFVAGYQYGAFFDAYISITTETSEQLTKLKTKIQATMDAKDTKASADIGHEVSDALKESNAQVTIRIVTNGMGKQPIELGITHSGDYAASTAGISQVFTELMNFRNKLAKDVNPESYAPIRVRLKRWRSIFDIAMVHEMQIGTGVTDDYVAQGYVPVPATKLKDIGRFNAILAETRGHWNEAMAIPTRNKRLSDAAADFEAVISDVTGKGNRFYTSGDEFAPTMAELERVDEIFRMYSDRYTFYKKLMVAQRNEKATYEALRKSYNGKTKTAEKEEVMDTMPYGAPSGGESGYDTFDQSEFVTADINAGGISARRYYSKATERSGGGWAHWHQDHKSGQGDYLASAGPATIIASTDKSTDRARFCKIWVKSTADSAKMDNKREVVNVPAVGKLEARFEFESAHLRDADWTIKGQSIKMNGEDYPFDGLE